MNRIWIGIIALCLGYGVITGRIEQLSSAILALPIKGFDLCITLVVSACFWTGMMNIMLEIGVIKWIAKALNPLLKLIMPNLKDEEAKNYISSNIAANMFGLGFAATPSGLKAMKRLKELSLEKEGVASDEMITFLVLNTGGVTLIPVSVLSIRQEAGSSNPADFVFLAIISTLLACVAGLISDRIFRKINNKKK